MIWVAGRSPTLVSHSLRGAAMNLKATILTYLLNLPSYIEHDFSALQRLWMYAPPGTTIDKIIRNYCTSYCRILNRNDYKSD